MAGVAGRWHALGAAGACNVPRVALHIGRAAGVRAVGSVSRAHLPALRAWPRWFEERGDALVLSAAPHETDRALAEVNLALREQGLVRAWRDEPFPLLDPLSGEALATMERAACRFWGTLTLGAHATGFVRDARGAIAALWIAQRSPNKATDPGLFDNLIGGGVAAGQTPGQALVREGFEEAGLAPGEIGTPACASVLRLHRDIPEGLQHEWLHGFDIELPAGRVPHNRDGEVAAFRLLPVCEAAALAAGDTMTVDAALVTIDFLLRHGLLDDTAAADCVRRLRVHRI
jgi:8-oxo-dGTP pyrophosphatase MutT (NUDIX family)